MVGLSIPSVRTSINTREDTIHILKVGQDVDVTHARI